MNRIYLIMLNEKMLKCCEVTLGEESQMQKNMCGIIPCILFKKYTTVYKTWLWIYKYMVQYFFKDRWEDTHQLQGTAFVWEGQEGKKDRERYKGVFSCIGSILFLKNS